MAYTVTMSEPFVTWLTNEIKDRGWSDSELARRAGLRPSTLSMLISGRNQPGRKLCIGVAHALGIPEEFVFRKAGFLTPLPEEVDEEREALVLFRRLAPEQRGAAMAMLRGLARANPDSACTRRADIIADIHATADELPDEQARIEEAMRFARTYMDAASDEAAKALYDLALDLLHRYSERTVEKPKAGTAGLPADHN